MLNTSRLAFFSANNWDVSTQISTAFDEPLTKRSSLRKPSSIASSPHSTFWSSSNHGCQWSTTPLSTDKLSIPSRMSPFHWSHWWSEQSLRMPYSSSIQAGRSQSLLLSSSKRLLRRSVWMRSKWSNAILPSIRVTSVHFWPRLPRHGCSIALIASSLGMWMRTPMSLAIHSTSTDGRTRRSATDTFVTVEICLICSNLSGSTSPMLAVSCLHRWLPTGATSGRRWIRIFPFSCPSTGRSARPRTSPTSISRIRSKYAKTIWKMTVTSSTRSATNWVVHFGSEQKEHLCSDS